MDVIFHRKTDQRMTLIDISCVPGLGLNMYSLHAVQRTHLIVSDASGTHIIGTNLTFPRSISGSYLRATRLPAETVGARKMNQEMHATNLLRQLRHPVPPPPSRDVTWYYSKAPWTTPVRTAQIKPPEDIYVTMPKSVLVAAPFPAPAAAPLAPAPAAASPPASISKPPTPIPPCVGRDINTMETWRCPRRRVARPLQCATYCKSTPIAMTYCRWNMRLWCQCWRLTNQPTRSSVSTAPRKTRRTCRPRIYRIHPHQALLYPMSRSRLM